MRIFVAGHNGMVGSAIVRAIEAEKKDDWIGAHRNTLDLTDRSSVFGYLKKEKPDVVIIAAAKVGGIMANSTYPVDFLTTNLQIQSNLLDGAHAIGVPRLVFLGSSCIYPKFAEQPIHETSLLTGELEPTNEPYAVAKIAGLKLVQAYRQQFQRDWISLMPTNLYGPGDNYNPQDSHVIPGMISKFCEGKMKGSNNVTLWGTGMPLREFLHVDDLASATLFALQRYHEATPLNVGSGEEVSIRQLAHEIKNAVGFEGSIFWDQSKPDGTPRKLLDSSKLRGLGWEPRLSLREGLRQTVSDLGLVC